jgi:hypothetical protein
MIEEIDQFLLQYDLVKIDENWMALLGRRNVYKKIFIK